MAELVDAPDLGSGAVRRGGSSPFTRTTINHKNNNLEGKLPSFWLYLDKLSLLLVNLNKSDTFDNFLKIYGIACINKT